MEASVNPVTNQGFKVDGEICVEFSGAASSLVFFKTCFENKQVCLKLVGTPEFTTSLLEDVATVV